MGCLQVWKCETLCVHYVNEQLTNSNILENASFFWWIIYNLSQLKYRGRNRKAKQGWCYYVTSLLIDLIQHAIFCCWRNVIKKWGERRNLARPKNIKYNVFFSLNWIKHKNTTMPQEIYRTKPLRWSEYGLAKSIFQPQRAQWKLYASIQLKTL